MISLLHFAPQIPNDIEIEIQTRLSELEREHDIHFLFAIESGSRAWGFPSPDSDYDVRFVYARPVDWYLSIKPGRDVIETPIEGDWDINGWDVQKAIGLLLKPNPVLLEWMSSPVRYRWDDAVCQKLEAFAKAIVNPEQCLYHYYHLAKRQWERNIDGRTDVNLKKYFYVLRPAMAMRWVRLHPEMLPPMNLQALLAGTNISQSAQRDIAELLDAKSRSSEVGTGERITSIDEIILQEFAWYEGAKIKKRKQTSQTVESANALFRDIIRLTDT